jgi:hypothetical protein
MARSEGNTVLEYYGRKGNGVSEAQVSSKF